MRVDAAATYTAPLTLTRLASAPSDPAPVDPAPAPSDPAPADPAPSVPTGTTEPTFSRAHGMLRKLVAGGFNPVAAARHTEKFAEELKQAGVTPMSTPAKAKAVKSYAAPAPIPSVDTDA
jgi:hypothetical protein